MKSLLNKIINLLTDKISLALLCITSLGSSCDSFVEVDLPQSQLTATTVFADYSTADAALADIYAKMRDTGIFYGAGGLSFQLGHYSDELSWLGSPVASTYFFYSNALLPANTAVAEYWSSCYNQIYAANAVLEGSGASSSLSSTDKEKLKGEALFIRALLHFYLVNLFGDIPYITATEYKSNSTAHKIPVSRVYELIQSDLKDAVAMLQSGEDSGYRVRPGKTAASALLSRVYLYSGLWAEAANSASSVLNETERYTLENPNKVFLKESKETIWQLQSSFAGKNTDEASVFILQSAPPAGAYLNQNLIDAFSAGDLRKMHWTGSVTDGGMTWYYARKYKENNSTPVSVEYSVILRLAEQYLIRSEARAHQGDIIGAAEDLNEIRHRAGLGDTTAFTEQHLIDAVHDERRLELFTEHGHRFFDLKRSGQVNSVLAAIKPGWNTSDLFFPLPKSELELNPNLLPQNNGY